MFNMVQYERDIAGLLASATALLAVNVKLQRKMQLEAEVDMATIFTALRNGRGGAGLLVEMPIGTNKRPNVTGPVLDWKFDVVIVEQPAMNMAPGTGTNLSAEEILQAVMDLLHGYADDNLGTLQCVGFSTENSFPGCIAYRVHFTLLGKTSQTARTGPVAMVVLAGMVTLACAADPTAQIFYTTDGTMPVNQDGGNPSSQLYTAPFAVSSGDTVRAVAYAPGKNNSPASFYAVP